MSWSKEEIEWYDNTFNTGATPSTCGGDYSDFLRESINFTIESFWKEPAFLAILNDAIEGEKRATRANALERVHFNEQVSKIVEQRMSDKPPSKWETLFITVNPKDGIVKDPKDIESCILKLFSFKAITTIKVDASIEQRSTTTEWSGFHAHLIIQKPEKVSKANTVTEIRRAFSSAFQSLFPDKSSNFLHTKYGDKKYYTTCYKYLFGKKKGDEKNLKQEQDVLMREHFDLKKRYCNYEEEECLSTKRSLLDIEESVDMDVVVPGR